MLQFADCLPLALNQIMSEMATMHWRTAGGWECPVILMAPCGGYRPGLGPFHAQSFESLLAQIPGLDVLIPSNAADAVRLLNGAFEAKRPTVFFYPKALLHERFNPAPEFSFHRSELPGGIRQWTQGDDLTLVAWGNTVGLCRKAGDL
jgi:2-oxoisovalerate dehydrogenase E1 component